MPDNPAPPRHRWRAYALVLALVLSAPVTLAIAMQTAAGPAPPPELEPEPALTLPSDFDPYLRRATDERADPINIVFWASSTQVVVEAVERVLGWRRVEGSKMVFLDRGQRRPTAFQFGLPLGAGSRYHLRIEEVEPGAGQLYVLAAVHRDEMAPCGHVGHGFDEARDLIAGAFAAAGYQVAIVDAGHTASGVHCDGSYTPSDGRVALIRLEDTAP